MPECSRRCDGCQGFSPIFRRYLSHLGGQSQPLRKSSWSVRWAVTGVRSQTGRGRCATCTRDSSEDASARKCSPRSWKLR